MTDKQKIRKLEARIEELEDYIKQLKTGEISLPEKRHFDIDGEVTACGHEIGYLEVTDNIKEVTCRVCISAWNKFKKMNEVNS